MGGQDAIGKGVSTLWKICSDLSTRFAVSQGPAKQDSSQKSAPKPIENSGYHHLISQEAFKGHSPIPANGLGSRLSWFQGLSPLSLAGCKGKSKSKPNPADRITEEIFTVGPNGSYFEILNLEGNPKVGWVYFIPQSHFQLSRRKMNAIGNLREEERVQSVIAGRYHYEIVKYLAAKKAKHIFDEDWAYDLKPDHQMFQENRAGFQKVFLQGEKLLEKPEEKHISVLGFLGAAMLYAQLFDGIQLHKTWTEQERDKNIAQLKTGKGDPTFLNFTQREGFARREIMNFLKNNPGEEVYLFHGLAHDFLDDFAGLEDPPVFISVYFPEITEVTIDQIGAMVALVKMDPDDEKGFDVYIKKAKKYPDIQFLAVRKAEKIPAQLFEYIQTEKGQLTALDKLDYEEDSWTPPAGKSLSDYLLEKSLSTEVRNKVESKFGQQKRVKSSKKDK